jgi:hypothetical protein
MVSYKEKRKPTVVVVCPLKDLGNVNYTSSLVRFKLHSYK